MPLFLLPGQALYLQIRFGGTLRSQDPVLIQTTEPFHWQSFRLLLQTMRLMPQRYSYRMPVMAYESWVNPVGGCMRNPLGYTHSHSNRSLTAQFLQIMKRSKNKQYSKSLDKNSSYEDIYRGLKSPRSFDPFMGMQLGAVRLPPTFSFNPNNLNSKNLRGRTLSPDSRLWSEHFLLNITNI